VESALKTVRTLRIVFLFSVPLYLGIVQIVPSQSAPQIFVLYALAGLCVADIVAIFVFRKVLIDRSEQALAADPRDSKAVARWRAGYFAIYGMGLAVAIYGLIVHFFGFDLGYVLPFFVVGLGLLLYFPPRIPTNLRP
jgi:hypothetical protein